MNDGYPKVYSNFKNQTRQMYIPRPRYLTYDPKRFIVRLVEVSEFTTYHCYIKTDVV